MVGEKIRNNTGQTGFAIWQFIPWRTRSNLWPPVFFVPRPYQATFMAYHDEIFLIAVIAYR